MKSLILTTATRLMTPLILAFSLFMLLRGHDQPGGGFIGGLLAATAFCLFAKAEGVGPAREALRAPPLGLAMAGVGVSVLAGLWGMVVKGDFLQAVWPFVVIAEDGTKSGLPVGSVLMFDVGVYLAVVGAVTGLFLALEADAA
ncbi:MAG: MnhB domain-containing protein, partial [Rubrimonas sp.]